jgi:hypothetical protein
VYINHKKKFLPAFESIRSWGGAFMNSFFRSAVYSSALVMYAGYVISNAAYRNIALNPNDVPASQWTPAKGYPHATSNSEYPAPLQQPPNPEYYALNAIDGKTANTIETQHPS